MRHRKHTFKINRTGSHRRAMMANMACSLLGGESGQIKTTLVRAKELRRVVEKMITLGKRGSLHTRRQAIAYLRQPAVVRHLFDEIAPRFADRAGGYTRIMKLGPRVGDGAEMCIIELVTESLEAKAEKTEPAAEETASAEAAADEAGKTEEEPPAAEETEEAEETVDEPADETSDEDDAEEEK